MKSIPGGTITSPGGFLAGATDAGLKARGGLDLGILYSEAPCVAAGLFTANRIKAAPVLLCQEHIANGKAQAIVVNAGCANACTGEQGFEDAAEMASLAARRLGLAAQDVLVASTGVIGTRLPMELIGAGLEKVALSKEGGHQLAQAMTTTDTSTKERAVSLEVGGKESIIGGIAKGAGMIHPDLATLLSFLATDAAIDAHFLEQALREAVSLSFNMLTIDGDTSPNDMVLILANGVVGNKIIEEGSADAEAFQAALTEVCIYLVKSIARDGEGATKLIEVAVEGALSAADARVAARTVAGSPLVKAAVYGSDPNWGRIIAALGRSGAEVEGSMIDLFLNNICLMKGGLPHPFDEDEVREAMKGGEVPIRVCLNLGSFSATAWGCDLSEEYVTINSAYRT
ncbi:MAG: bifunctional glutamate N-acetyltransferase/amino-acid acetyltransferase ArgJ [Chloroflexi bacterium]|jgi:glutamate N-acetyltransferase/amino-acid N-acetyltransferase|nr:bifunctional glutamate N-acetyltransferase/amino-acid acetyltransferase ArgJ [Chloroflexota bacterium]